MRLEDNELNITPEVAAALGYAPAVARQVAPARQGRAVDRAGRIVRNLVAVLLGLFLLAVVGQIVASNRGAAAQTGATARLQPTPAIQKQAKRSKRHKGVPTSGGYLPAEYDIGRLGMPIWVVDRVPPHQSLGYVDANFLGQMPEGTSVLFERQNVNGWRRVVSYDTRYAGYAQIFPTTDAPQPMQPGFAILISRLRRIP